MLNNYTLDTNVLISNPCILEQLENSRILIPSVVVWELDKHKDKYGARQAIRYLENLRKQGPLTSGVKAENNCMIYVMPAFAPDMNPDDIILDFAKQNGSTVVSDDLNVRLKANILNIKACPALDIMPEQNKKFFAKQDELDESVVALNGFAYVHNRLFRKLQDGSMIEVEPSSGVFGITPRNIEQECVVNLLLDPSVQLVSLAGKAGTGKSLLALAASLELVMKKKQFERLVVVKPIVTVGKDIGYLPGSMEDKLQVWSIAIMDLLDILLSGNKHFGLDYLMESGMVSIVPPAYLRGQTFINTIVVVDEAQNLSRHEIKTIVTRMGDNSKIILTGDTKQIDSQLTEHDNGLALVASKFINQPLAGAMELVKTERSTLASLAADLL